MLIRRCSDTEPYGGKRRILAELPRIHLIIEAPRKMSARSCAHARGQKSRTGAEMIAAFLPGSPRRRRFEIGATDDRDNPSARREASEIRQTQSRTPSSPATTNSSRCLRRKRRRARHDSDARQARLRSSGSLSDRSLRRHHGSSRGSARVTLMPRSIVRRERCLK